MDSINNKCLYLLNFGCYDTNEGYVMTRGSARKPVISELFQAKDGLIFKVLTFFWPCFTREKKPKISRKGGFKWRVCHDTIFSLKTSSIIRSKKRLITNKLRPNGTDDKKARLEK